MYTPNYLVSDDGKCVPKCYMKLIILNYLAAYATEKQCISVYIIKDKRIIIHELHKNIIKTDCHKSNYLWKRKGVVSLISITSVN